ncbi:MAG: hypothetical protein RL011_2307, partial [Pseudomonadota bacterium]
MSNLKVSALSTALFISAACKAPHKQSQDDLEKVTPKDANGDNLALIGPVSGLKNFADWYRRHTAGEKSSRVLGRILPSVPISETQKVSVAPAKTYCHNGEEAQPLDCALLPKPSATDIRDQNAAIRLGKALFWDMQVGSDGKTACATCHYQAGADARTLNTLHPGPDGEFRSGGVTAPNQNFKISSITNDDRIGSQGIENSTFQGLSTKINDPKDNCKLVSAFPFGSHRAVTGRNTPTVIGAIFNVENFWDGRASTKFNGFDPFGDTANADQKIILANNASLASQAVGPVDNAVEMACSGRQFNGPNSVAEKMISRPVLQFQRVSKSDSVLGTMSALPSNGLRCGPKPCTYQDLITAAFRSEIARDAMSN